MPILLVGGRSIAYEVERSARRKRLALVITPDKRVIAKAPLDLPQAVIEAFVARNVQWVLANLAGKAAAREPEVRRQVGDEQGVVEVRIVRSSRRRSLSIYVRRGGEVEVRVPAGTPLRTVEQFVRANLAWVRQRQAELAAKPAAVRTWETGDTLLVEGELLRLEVEEGPHRTIRVIRQDATLKISLPVATKPSERKEMVRDAVRRWLMQLALQRTRERLPVLAKAVGVTPRRVRLKDMASRWGSCTGTNSISLTYRIVMAPPGVMDYVLIHELCHLVHRNHSKQFWALVASHAPDYREHKAWLRHHAYELEI